MNINLKLYAIASTCLGLVAISMLFQAVQAHRRHSSSSSDGDDFMSLLQTRDEIELDYRGNEQSCAKYPLGYRWTCCPTSTHPVWPQLSSRRPRSEAVSSRAHNGSKITSRTVPMVQHALECMAELVMKIMADDYRFPQTCCKLRIFYMVESLCPR